MLRIFNNFNKINEYLFVDLGKKKNFLISKILSNVKKQLSNILIYITLNNNDFEFFLKNDLSNKILFAFFKNSIVYQLQLLIDIVGCDFPGKLKRFGLIYLYQSIQYNIRINFFIKLLEKEKVQSIITLFKNANWAERECWDLFGIFFEKHTDLRRILTDYGFHAFPLRKDFPLSGFYEIIFLDLQKTIKNKPVCLAQEYRKFYFPMPW